MRLFAQPIRTLGEGPYNSVQTAIKLTSDYNYDDGREDISIKAPTGIALVGAPRRMALATRNLMFSEF